MIKKHRVSVWVTIKVVADVLEVSDPKQVMNTTLQNLFKDNEVLIDPEFTAVVPQQFDLYSNNLGKPVYSKKLKPKDYMHLVFGGAK
jgi:hypothetical protein